MMRLLLNPWVLLAATVALAASHWYAHHQGYERAMDQAQAEQLVAVQRAIEQYQALEAQDREIEAAWAEQMQERRVVYRTIRREVTRYVENRGADPECLDADGLRLVAAAARGAAPAQPPGGAAGDLPRDPTETGGRP